MAKIDKILGSISPLYGAISGKGLFGKGMVALGDAMGPAAGLMPMGASELEKRRRRKRAGEPADTGEGMKRGGKAKKYAKGGKVTRGDGIAKKGHTKGKMV